MLRLNCHGMTISTHPFIRVITTKGGLSSICTISLKCLTRVYLDFKLPLISSAKVEVGSEPSTVPPGEPSEPHSGAVGRPSSRQSSLESGEEPELADINVDSRPSTAHSRLAAASRHSRHSEATTTHSPIEIPQVPTEVESRVSVL